MTVTVYASLKGVNIIKSTAIRPPEWLSKNAVYQINPRTFSKEGTIGAITRENTRLPTEKINRCGVAQTTYHKNAQRLKINK